MPWETPVTDVYGQRLRGMMMGLRTELAIARAVDKGDLDQIAVHPLPVHERILDAFARLGFQFKSADLERGHIRGVNQTLPFYQEIEYFAAPRYAHAIRELELTFVTGPHAVDVILECDKRGGLFTAGHDSFGRYTVGHGDVDQVDWIQQVGSWVDQTVAGHGTRAHGFSPGHHGHGGRGGIGSAVAGAALGVAGGVVAGEMLENAFEGDFGSGDEGFFE